MILDACVVLSLYASRRMAEILDINPGPFLIAEAVLREALFVYALVDGVPERELVVLDPLLASGHVSVVAPETEKEFQTLIDLALELDDGEAMTCAIALHRGYRIATDEKKTIRLVGNRVPIIGTLDLVRTWADTVSAPPDLVRDMLIAIIDRGYEPGPTHVHRAWWETMLGDLEG